MREIFTKQARKKLSKALFTVWAYVRKYACVCLCSRDMQICFDFCVHLRNDRVKSAERAEKHLRSNGFSKNNDGYISCYWGKTRDDAENNGDESDSSSDKTSTKEHKELFTVSNKKRLR